MKGPSDELFVLIRSMNKTEKRYFKIYSGTFPRKQPNYLRLFDAIEHQKNEYDETQIKKLFEKEKTIVNHLPSLKIQLYNLVLKSLENYSRDSSIELQINEMLNDVEILYNRTLYLQSYKILLKAKKAAYLYELFEQLLNILKWEERLANTNLNYLKIDKKKIAGEKGMILQYIANLNGYNNLADKMYELFIKTGIVRNEKELIAYKRIITHPLLSAKKSALTLNSRFLFHYIYGFYHFICGNNKRSLKHNNAQLQLLEKNPAFQKFYIKKYIDTLYNMLNNLQHETRSQSMFFKVLNKLKSISVDSEPLQINLFISTHISELMMYAKRGDFEKGRKVINDIEIGITAFQGRMNKNNEQSLFFTIAYIFFGTKDYKNSRIWINRIIGSQNPDPRADIQCMARLLNLLIYFEQKSGSSMEYYIRATYRFLISEKRLFRIEQLFLNFARIVFPKANGPTEQKNAFKELEKQLITLSTNKFEAKVFSYFDFISWVRSKIENRLFAEVVKEKSLSGKRK